MKKKLMIMMAALLGAFLLFGCGQNADYDAAVDVPEEEEYYEEYYEEDDAQDVDAAADEETDAQDDLSAQDNSAAVGVWYTDGYDEDDNWAMSYKIELTAEGNATCTGWRNKDAGFYEMTGDNTALITFDQCETDNEGAGFEAVEGFVYTIEMTINGDDATIKIDAPDVISNLTDGTVHKNPPVAAAEEGDEGEGTDVADGEYITDPTYKGDISSDGATLSIETGLSHYDADWNTVPDYEKRTFVFSTSKDCKCVIYQEDKEEYPIAEQVQFINEFLSGNSGLPITLKIKNNELIEIGFSS